MTDNATPNGPYSWTTYAERLEAAGVPWKVYQDEVGLNSYNMLPHFQQFQDAAPGSPLYEKGLKISPAGQFEYDAINDKLPAVSWLMTAGGVSEHPAETPAGGASFVASKIGAIAANPDVWKKTVFILNYDENDGLFDHVVPPTAPEGTKDEYVMSLPIGGGFRVPCIVVSPWTAGGWVSSQKFDHTSTIQFLERLTGVKETNISAWRRRTFGDLTSVFQKSKLATPPLLPDTESQLNLANYEVEQLPAPSFPGAAQVVPHQEKGSRHHL
ncbi:MAG TPA: alkaline phosphatase family protein [Mycobacteriales bacterium]|nr:alkaline phosphatase family protein [Mycobacteriales bacterium]